MQLLSHATSHVSTSFSRISLLPLSLIFQSVYWERSESQLGGGGKVEYCHLILCFQKGESLTTKAEEQRGCCTAE
ncbi:unnamed protein product [Linum trigynum]|uniref:Uncharacterized protein n=1 Tax=Linum trigynum TaxID=586398 RepID=A0AAV2F1S0_9ROSI